MFVLEAPMSIVAVDLDMRFVAASPAVLNGAGRTMDEIRGMRVDDLVPGAAAGLGEIVEGLAAGAPRHKIVQPANLPGGRVRWFESQGSYWHDDDGKVAGYLLTNRDITAEREAEAARREVEVLLQAVVDNMPATLAVIDLETERFLLANARIAQASGIPVEDIIGKRASDFNFSDDAQQIAEQIASLRAPDGPRVTERFVTFSSMGGRILRSKKLLFDDGSGRERVLSIGEDVTDLHQANRALEAAVAEAEAANAAKSRFLANVSHEIRTPLNGVLGMAQAMALDALPLRQRERLDVIRQSGETLLTLLNDLLDLSKIEAGKVELETLEFDLASVVRHACAPFEMLAEQKGVTLAVRVEADLGRRLGDPTRLRQVLDNLVSNAVKFTERGRIEVSVATEGDDLAFVVADTGLGMRPETLETMFEKFAQGDASTTRRFGGTGLGLAICRDLVELMGGRIAAESVAGQGSRFSFVLPLPRAASARDPGAAPEPEEDAMRPMRLLAAEDNSVNRLVLSTLLEQAGLSVTLVVDGAEAVEAWAREPWDAILMDVQMPVMDGLAATAAIRAREAAEGRPRTPIIALTADAMTHHASEYAACGMDAVVPKPIQMRVLLQALEAAVAASSANETRTTRAG